MNNNFLKNKIFKVVSQVTEELNLKAFVIGGFVRDLHLNRPSKDIDIVVEGKGIELAFKIGKSGETYNIGGRNERNNLQIVDTICEILNSEVPRKEGRYQDLITFVKDRPGHDMRYAIDATKIETELGWKADENFETGIRKTITWYLEKFQA